jgi:hypothetical protein
MSDNDFFLELTNDIISKLDDNIAVLILCACPKLVTVLKPVVIPHVKLLGISLTASLTTKENIQKFEECTSVHGIGCGVIVLDQPGDVTHVLTFKECPKDGVELETKLANFFTMYARGQWPRAKLGEPRPRGDMDPDHPHLKAGVQCSFKELVYHGAPTVLVIFWSQRCPSCGDALRLVDCIIKNTQCSICIEGVSCNVDENEYEPEDWPTSIEDQVVPLLKLYVDTADGTKRQCRFQGARTFRSILDWIAKNASGGPIDVDQIVQKCEGEEPPRKIRVNE